MVITPGRLGVAFAVVIIDAGFAVVTLVYAGAEGDIDETVKIVLMVIGAVTGLIAVMAGLVTLLGALQLANREHAFGLPAGTVRGTIALSLVVLFAVLAVVLYFDLADKDPNDEATRFANQVLTTISTLVVAVAAFYFGTKAVAAARGMAPPRITGVDPAKFPPTDQAKEFTIRGENLRAVVSAEIEVGGVRLAAAELLSNAGVVRATFGPHDILKAPGTGSLSVTTDVGETAERKDAFVIEAEAPAPAPTESLVTPPPSNPDVTAPTIGPAGAANVPATAQLTNVSDLANVRLRPEDGGGGGDGGDGDLVAASSAVSESGALTATFAPDARLVAGSRWRLVVVRADGLEGISDVVTMA